MTFADYLQSCRTQIIQRPDYLTADKNLQQCILTANSPFEWNASAATRKAVLLIHGLYDSPSSMHSLAQFFVHENYLVRGLLLPGHGTCPEDLLNIHHQQWLNLCQSAITQLPTTIDHLVLCGFSTGGLVNHYLSLKQTIPQLRALVSLAPALALHAPQWILNNRLACHILKKILPWHYTNPRYDYARYNKHAFHAGCQVQRLIQASQTLSPEIYQTLPVFYIVASEDEVINSQAVIHFFQQHCTHPQSRCLTYGATTTQQDPRFIYRPSRWPQQHIDSFSHIALPIDVHHPHYGVHGDYTRESCRLLKPGQKALFGKMRSRANIRLSYNPDFDYMSARLREFLRAVV